MNADSIKIECEEDGFHLIIDGDSPYPEYQASIMDYNIQSCAEALAEQVNLIIAPWIREQKREKLAFLCNPDESGGLADLGTKHPDYHSIHADLYDVREGK